MKKRIMKTKKTMVFIVMVSMLMPALSMAWVTYPGTMCRLYDPQGSDDFFDPGGHKANGLQNDSSVDKYVTCPIVWDYSESLNGYIYIRSDEAVCDLFVVDRFSNFGTGEWESFSMPNDTSQDGVWRYHNSTAPTSSYGNTASIYCKIPAGAVINAYLTDTID